MAKRSSSGKRRKGKLKSGPPAAENSSGDKMNSTRESAGDKAFGQATRIVFPVPSCPTQDDSMNLEDVPAVAEMAYVWGWPLMNVANRVKLAQKFANGQPLLVNGMPIGYNAFALQTQNSDPKERIICCPNADTLYGGGAFDLGTNGAVIQVPPGIPDIFWLYSLYNARTNQFGAFGKQHATAPGFYLIRGPHWDAATNPDPIVFDKNHQIACDTDLALTTARVFIKPAQPISDWLDQMNFYPAQKYNGKYQPGGWGSLKNVSCPGPTPPKEMKYVRPLIFFHQLPAILDRIDPQDDQEKELYGCFRKLLKLAENPRVMRICEKVARETEQTTIQSYMEWRMNGVEAGNGWYTSVDSAKWNSTQYVYRTATAKSNLFQNQPEDTRYYFTDTDTNNLPLAGQNSYAITFKQGTPPARGPWSVTVYNQNHFLYKEPYSISILPPLKLPNNVTFYAAPVQPQIPNCYWMRTPPNEPFSLYLRAYGMDDDGLVGPWIPPLVELKR